MKKILLSLTVAMAVISCKNDSKIDGAQVAPKDLNQEELDASYAFGVSLGERAEQYKLNPQAKDSLIYDEVMKGVKDYLKSPNNTSYYYGVDLGKTIQGALENEVIKGHLSTDEIIKGLKDLLDKKQLRVSKDSAKLVMDNFYQSRIKDKENTNLKEGMAFMNKIKAEKGVVTTNSGLAYRVLSEGTGPKIKIGDKLKIKYTGTKVDGEIFDSTEKSSGGEPIEFVLQEGGLIPGWVEGLQLMSKGGKYNLYIPSELGYGNTQNGIIEPGQTLIFDIEVVDVEQANDAK